MNLKQKWGRPRLNPTKGSEKRRPYGLYSRFISGNFFSPTAVKGIKNKLSFLQIHHQRSRYIYDLYYKRQVISKELYDFCLETKLADVNLIAKWKKQGYENLCCLRCIQTKDTNFRTNCICRVPKSKLDVVIFHPFLLIIWAAGVRWLLMMCQFSGKSDWMRSLWVQRMLWLGGYPFIISTVIVHFRCNFDVTRSGK